MIVDVLLPLALAFIMFSLGLTLVPQDFLRLVARPKAVGLGLFGQIVLVPVLAYAAVRLGGFTPEIAVGLLILAACPGGVSSGLLTHLARGDTALSITLTAISSVAAVATLPFLVDFALGEFAGTAAAPMDIPVGRLVRGVFMLTTVPVALGMAIRHFRPHWADRAQGPAGKLATVLFVLIVIATFVAQRQVLAEHLGRLGPAVLLLNAAIMTMGWGVAAAAGLERGDRIAVAMECGLQNAALGIFVAATVLRQPALAVPSVVYALLMNVGAIALVFYLRRRGAATGTA